jgi:uncharacterized NAD(P)/FAD-binding protein YdhS
VPRALYGRYLENTAHRAIARLEQRGWRVRVVDDWVTGYEPLRTADGTTHEVDHLVLCVGGGGPLDHYQLSGNPGFVLEPYPLARTLDDVAADAHVAVIGSGLTAVDIVAGLTANGHTGPITMLSRRGELPDVQQKPRPLQFRHLARENLPDTLAGLVSLMEAELADLGQDIAPLAAEVTSTEGPVERLVRQLSEVDSPYMGRRLLVATVHMLGTFAWRRLPPAEQALLRTTYRRTATRMASPMIPSNAEIVRRLFDDGQLRLLSGQPKIQPSGRVFRIHGAHELTADVVVNAVNPPAHAIPEASASVVDGLLSAGAVTVAESGGLAARSGRVHTLGAITAGTSFVTPSVPTLAAAAGAMASLLVAAQDGVGRGTTATEGR